MGEVAPVWHQRFHIKNVIAREFLAEFIGTFILIIFGDGVVAQVLICNYGVYKNRT